MREIFIDGELMRFRSASDSGGRNKDDIREFNRVKQLTVMENIFLGRGAKEQDGKHRLQKDEGRI